MRQAEQRLAIGLGKAPDAGMVFTEPNGDLKNPALYSAQFPDLVKAAGLPRVSLHSLRHSHITDLLRRGVNVKVVSERAGHASVAVTLAIYSHVLPGMQEDVAALLDRSFGTRTGNVE